MDPHSTHSQFNQRTAQPPKIAIEKYAKSPSPAKADRLLSLAQRPIATNSRVRQGEQFKRDMFIAFINKALQEKLNGHSKDFDDLLRLWVLALSHVLSKLERRHGSLVEAISYTVFIGMLLSARPEYLAPVLSKIAQGLTYRGPESSSSPLTRSVVYDRLHHLLRHLLSLIPTLPSTLQPLLVRHFPHKRQSQVTQVTYIRNLLRVTEYCSELTDRILALIIDRALQIDVEIQVELEELEQDDTLENGDLFEFDPFDVVVGQEDDKEPDLPSNVRHMQEMVNKLDHVLKLIFDHFNRLHNVTETPTVSSPTTPHSDSPFSPLDTLQSLSPESMHAMRAAQFYTLLAIFDRAIIRTFKSRYTQFLLFWYSSLDPEFSDLFQGLLVEKALIGQDVPIASYIASFVSRAQFVDREGARRMVTVLCTFLQNHLDAFDKIIQAGQEPPSLAHHNVFYAIVQAVFLIFCFRWRDLQEEFDEVEAYPGRKKWMNELDVVQRMITSPLNPLKVCSSNVVMQFARIAQATNFVYCHSIIEANRRSEYNPSPGSLPLLPRRSGEELVSAELHTFFPFDPYRLPRSGSYIQGVYREWSSVAIEGDEESDEEEDGEDVDEGDGELDHVGMLSVNPNDDGALGSNGLQIPRAAQASSSDADGLGESFGGMSISPAQPRSVIMAS
ncbi:RNA polymerase I-specific transcription initiation factor RRN3-domain-containing protein [Boletus edulis]|nr:RNA polymerase I-specific transcription initiation factor RRN3-domain-containing protein [Boletus edulis]